MAKQILKFPKDFLWGAASSAYQTEGGNSNTDWWAWERSEKRIEYLKKQGKKPEDFFSGIACDFYNRYEEDFTLAEHLSHNSTRFGVEWARIEPEEGKFDEAVLDHYEKILQSAKFHKLKVFLTLHHFTLPLWLARKGGFTKQSNISYFLRYAEKVTNRLNDYVDFWLTFNEPEVYTNLSYVAGRFPPQKKSFISGWKVVNNIITAHNAASAKIKKYLDKPVSMAYHLSDLQPASRLAEITTAFGDYLANKYILNRTINNIDFIGVNYYFHHHVGLFGPRKHSKSGHTETDLGWGIHPDGLGRVLDYVKKFNKPIYITENGLADSLDQKREKYIKDHLFYVHKAIQNGVDVKGYLYWSLTDNFEWDMGFAPRFGLIEIDRQDLLRRKVRYSATKFAEICKSNILEY